jgi:4'-phosphopantetheinyl transferase
LTIDDKVSLNVPNAEGPLSGGVEVWSISLCASESAVSTLEQLLSEDEIARANRFRFEEHRRRYTIGRGVLRSILGSRLGIAAKELQFRYEEYGRPELLDHQNSLGISFNMAHSGDLAVVAVSEARRVGIDLEQVRNEVQCLELAQNYFSPRERDQIACLPASDQTAAFFACWTRKEAFLKALGMGLSYPLSEFTVTVSPDATPALEEVESDPLAVNRWHFVNLQLADGYFGTLVYDNDHCEIKTAEWTRTD